MALKTIFVHYKFSSMAVTHQPKAKAEAIEKTHLVIKGVAVELPVIKSKGFKSLEDLKKEPEHIFSHLNPVDQDIAYDELWKAIAPAAVASADKASALPQTTPKKDQ